MSSLISFLRDLTLRDQRGNVMPLMAAALIPLLALTGGSIDMGRSYLAQSRLQQACDAGVLAARKKIGTSLAGGQGIPDGVTQAGNKFFSINFRDGSYGTKNRKFDLTLESDFSLSGKASVDVPTTIMQMFGQANVSVKVECAAQIGMINTDVMMVLDVTGSMMETNSGDPKPKLELMKEAVLGFYSQIAGSAAAGTRVRFGFVPYSTNVNAGSVLKDEWVTTNWDYQSRQQTGNAGTVGTVSYWAVGNPISGTADRTVFSTYPATLTSGKYTCSAAPKGSKSYSFATGGTTTEPFLGPPSGTLTRTNFTFTYTGTEYVVELAGDTCTVTKITYTLWKVSYDWVTQPSYISGSEWLYTKVNFDVPNWRTETPGCMEEPDTIKITRDDLLAGKVDLKAAIDLDIDQVPVAGQKSHQWRPMYPGLVYGRKRLWNGSGAFEKNSVTTTDEYVTPKMLGTSHCLTPVQKLKEMTSGEVSSYLGSLKVGGSTYHDTGLLWGARLISPNGLFAAENADVSANQPTGRNIVMLTDGQTSALDLSYNGYGFEPVDQRRWEPNGPDSLTAIVEARFSFICQEARKRNIQIWFIAFGTELNPMMQNCAGPGHAFEASNAAELAAAFGKISGQIADLRVTR